MAFSFVIYSYTFKIQLAFSFIFGIFFHEYRIHLVDNRINLLTG